MTIADTDVPIDYLAGKGEADTVERLLRLGALRTTVISRFELLSGDILSQAISSQQHQAGKSRS